MNVSNIIGRLTKDPELKYTQNTNKAVCSIVVAVDKYNAATQQKEADFIPVVVWGKQAESLCTYMSKGSQIGVTAHLQSRSYESDGKKNYVLELVADKIDFLSKKELNKEESLDDSNQDSPF